MDLEELKKLIDEDDLGLLEVRPEIASHNTPEEKTLQKFAEVNDFFDQTGREPSFSSADPLENSLAYRLKGIREKSQMWFLLKGYDKHHLLKEPEERKYLSVEEVYTDDELGLFHEEQDIFTLTHISKDIVRPDYIGRTKTCDDFENFKQLFLDCQHDLKCGDRVLAPFTREDSIREGTFFICGGVMYYIDKMENPRFINGRKQARLRCVIENGTESDILNRSLAKNLYKDGRIVTPNINDVINNLYGITQEDQFTGYIYILESRSRDERVRSIKNLYKIGYSETTVQERIKNAATETTYLMAPVSIIETYKTFNMNTQKMEFLLHRFFDSARISIDVNDIHGTRHTVREWFQIPLGVIKQAVSLTITGEIIQYRYDRDSLSVVLNTPNCK